MRHRHKLTLIFRYPVLLTVVLLLMAGRGPLARPIQGRVVDQDTGQPLPFVTLSVAGGRLTNETNADGYFRLDVPEQFSQDTLTFLAVNYQITQLPLVHATADLTIRLTAALPSAQPAPANAYFSTQQPFAARDTLLRVVANIAKNYPARPTLLQGFYREAITNEQTNACVLYAEGLVDIYKPPYSFTRKDDQMHFIKGRRKPLTTFPVPVLTPGPYANSMLDVVKYGDFLFRKGKVNTDYDFELTGNGIIGGQPVYIIRFAPRKARVATGYFAGRLFLTIASLAIIRAEYELTKQGTALMNRSRVAQIYRTMLLQPPVRCELRPLRWAVGVPER